MLWGLIRLIALIIVLVVIGVAVVALLGGAFRFGVGVAACPAGGAPGAGPVPAWVRGGYEVSVVVQVGEFVIDEAGRLIVEADAARVAADGCA